MLICLQTLGDSLFSSSNNVIYLHKRVLQCRKRNCSSKSLWHTNFCFYCSMNIYDMIFPDVLMTSSTSKSNAKDNLWYIFELRLDLIFIKRFYFVSSSVQNVLSVLERGSCLKFCFILIDESWNVCLSRVDCYWKFLPNYRRFFSRLIKKSHRHLTNGMAQECWHGKSHFS